MCGCFAGGTLFIDLAAATQSHTALSSVAQALDLDADPGIPLLKALQDGLRSRQLLLVLDNLEQVLVLGPLLGQVLSAAPRVKMLATSRELLNISIEQACTLSPLASRSHDNSDWHSPAVELFAQRARTVAPQFTLNDANGATIAAICRRLDGLPLAIELAAARVAMFTPAEILKRLEQRLPVLTAGTRDLPDRHRSLSATLDWSHALLSADEQALFRRLGVFAGGFSLRAVEMFCDVDEPAQNAEGELSSLVAKNLLTRSESGNGESRYAMLETIHAYALDQLRVQGEWDVWHERLAEYLLALVAQVHFRRALPADAENWRAAVSWAIAAARLEDVVLPLLQAFAEFGITHRERITWLDLALAQPRIALQPAAHAGVLSLLGQSFNMVDDLAQAMRHLGEGLAICKRHNLHAEALDILFMQGLGHRCLGETAQARSALLECMACCREWGFDERMPHLQVTLAEVETLEGNGERALRLVNEALENGANESPFLQAWTPNHKAHALQLLGDLTGAQAQAQLSLDTFRRLDLQDDNGFMWNYSTLAEIALSRRDVAATVWNAQRCFEAGDTAEQKSLLSWGLAAMAGACALNHQPERGARLWGASEMLLRQYHIHAAPASQQNRERTVTLLREQLGNGEFERLAAEGASLSMDEAMSLALA